MAYYESDDVEVFDDGVIDDVKILDERASAMVVEMDRLLGSGNDIFADPIFLDELPAKLRKKVAKQFSKRFQGVSGVGKKSTSIEEVNGYQLYGCATPPFNLDYLRRLSVENFVHSACIHLKASAIVGLGYFWEETPVAKQKRAGLGNDSEALMRFSNDLAELRRKMDIWLDGLNLDDDITDILYKVWMDVEATGNGYLEIGRNRNGSIGYLGHIPAHTMRIRVARDGFVQVVVNKAIYFRNFADTQGPVDSGYGGYLLDLIGSTSVADTNEVLHFKKHSPYDIYYGVPDIVSAMSSVAGDKFAASYNLDYFENKAVPRYALIVKGAKLSAASERRILEFFRKEVRGKHHGTLYIPVPAPMGTNVDVQLQPVENSIQDSSFSNYHELNVRDIITAHRVPPSKILGGGSMASAREENKTFVENVCRPEQRRVEKKLNRIVMEMTDMIRFNFKEYDLVDEETKSRIHDRYIRLGVISPNEARSDLGLPPRPDGDTYMNLGLDSEVRRELMDAQAEALLSKIEAVGFNPSELGGRREDKRYITEGKQKRKQDVFTPVSETGRATVGQRMDEEGEKPN